MKPTNESFSGSLNLWSVWIWRLDEAEGLWRILDISPQPEEAEEIKDPRDWVTCMGSKGCWYGPESLFREAFRQAPVQNLDKGSLRPELLAKKNSKALGPCLKKKPKKRGPRKKD